MHFGESLRSKTNLANQLESNRLRDEEYSQVYDNLEGFLERRANSGLSTVTVYRFESEKHWWYSYPVNAGWQWDLAQDIMRKLKTLNVGHRLDKHYNLIGMYTWKVVATW